MNTSTDSLRNKIPQVDHYINSFPDPVQKILCSLRETIRAELPDAEEVISYGVPVFKVSGHALVYFAGYKKHISMYPVSEKIVQGLAHESTYAITGKGTIQFPIDKPLPLELIRKIVRVLLKKCEKRYAKTYVPCHAVHDVANDINI